jgi:hypothetical protein
VAGDLYKSFTQEMPEGRAGFLKTGSWECYSWPAVPGRPA